VNIIILDDYQDAVRKLQCSSILESLNAKVFTNTVKGIGQLSVRLRDADVLVLIRERTQFPKQLLEKLPKLKLISQTGKVGSHIIHKWPEDAAKAVSSLAQVHLRTGDHLRAEEQALHALEEAVAA